MQFGWLNLEKPAGGILHLMPSGLGMPWNPSGRGERLLKERASGILLKHHTLTVKEGYSRYQSQNNAGPSIPLLQTRSYKPDMKPTEEEAERVIHIS